MYSTQCAHYNIYSGWFCPFAICWAGEWHLWNLVINSMVHISLNSCNAYFLLINIIRFFRLESTSIALRMLTAKVAQTICWCFFLQKNVIVGRISIDLHRCICTVFILLWGFNCHHFAEFFLTLDFNHFRCSLLRKILYHFAKTRSESWNVISVF